MQTNKDYQADKNEILEIYDSIHNEDKNLDFRLLIIIYLTIIIILSIVLPKIYIRNEIYYLSKDISKLDGEYSVLKEENKHLKQKLESIRFKHQVLDPLNIE